VRPAGRLSGVEDPDARSGDAGEPGRWLVGRDGFDVVPVPEPESELVEEGEAAAAGKEAGPDVVVEQGLAFERATADALVAGEYDETGLADDGQPGGVSGARRYRAAGCPGQVTSPRR
jgi:hypothetical protein